MRVNIIVWHVVLFNTVREELYDTHCHPAFVYRELHNAIQSFYSIFQICK